MRPDLALIPLPHIYSLDELVRGQRLYGSELFPEARVQRSGQGKDSRRPWLSTPEQVQWIQFWVEQSERPVMWALGEPEFDRFLSPYLAPGFSPSRVIGPARDRGSSPPLTERVLQSMQGFHPDNAPRV